jgi:predicted acylesterase/phospholipase RssA
MTPGRSHVERIKIGPKRKIAFVCSGGAAKAGAFHLGVALALQEQGFKFYGGQTPSSGAPRTPDPMEISTYVGSSAGSIITSFLAAGYSLDNIFNSFLDRQPEDPIDPADISPRILPRLTYQKMFKIRPVLGREQLAQLMFFRKIFTSLMNGNWEALLQFKWLKATGLFSTVGIEQYMREEVMPSNKFDDYLADLFIVATQLNHSRKVVFGKHRYDPPAHDLNCQYENRVEISRACAASTSLPPVFSPYSIEHGPGEGPVWYIDGEIRDTLSSHVALDAGADLVIASYSHQPLHYSKEIGSLTEHGLSAIVTQSIFLLIEQKIKNHIHNKEIQRNAIVSVSQYCKDSGVSEAHRRRICEILEAELHHRMDVDTIYIHPSPTDAQFFFGENFTLAPKIMTETVRSGFRAAIDVLRKYDFADRVRKPATGSAAKNG